VRLRIGQGFDVHRLVAGRPLRLGGVEVPHSRGLEGHSDGDCAIHAVCDALLGALGEGDMGRHFPSSDPRWRGVASREFLEEAVRLVRQARFEVGNLDVTLIAQEPVLSPHLEAMRETIAGVLGAHREAVSMKAKSTDHLGALGRGEGIAALAVVLLTGSE
jgi:2-C-methyl-D-erythritol 2,4-cyclodiphosphate synthase